MRIILIILSIFLTSCNRNECRIKVLLNNDKTISAKYIQTYVSGVSNIKKCDGDDIQLNTSDIKKVIE